MDRRRRKREETEVQNFKKIRINIDEMYAKPVISQRVLDDNEINLDTWMFENVCQNISMLENAAFINGDGQKKPTGILKHERTQEKAEEFEKIQEIEAMLDDKNYLTDVIIAVIASMNPCYLKDACFLMNSKTLSYLRQLKDQNDNYVWQRQLTQGFPETLFGYKVHIVHEMDDIENGKSPIAFGNFKHGYKIIDRKDITMIKDPYSAKPYVEFYMTKRVGGGVVNPAAIKLISIEKEKKKGGGK